MAEKPVSWLLVCLMWAGPVWGFSVAPQVNCPTQFRGIASEVIEPEGATSALSKERVVFEVQEAIKGSVAETMEVEFLKFGPLNLEVGKEYVVQLSKGKLCWVEAVE